MKLQKVNVERMEHSQKKQDKVSLERKNLINFV
jgi:hypothetical protein